MVRRNDGQALGHEVLGDGRVPAAVLGKAVRDHDDAAWRARRSTRF